MKAVLVFCSSIHDLAVLVMMKPFSVCFLCRSSACSISMNQQVRGIKKMKEAVK